MTRLKYLLKYLFSSDKIFKNTSTLIWFLSRDYIHRAKKCVNVSQRWLHLLQCKHLFNFSINFVANCYRKFICRNLKFCRIFMDKHCLSSKNWHYSSFDPRVIIQTKLIFSFQKKTSTGREIWIIQEHEIREHRENGFFVSTFQWRCT